MTDLPEVNGCNALMVVLDKMGKLSRLVPCRAGENQLTAPEVAKLFSKIGLDSLECPSMLFMIGTYVSQRHSGRHFGVSWVLVRCLVVRTILRLMVRLNGKIERLSR